MAEQVNVCVLNNSDKDIEVVRELPDGTRDLYGTIGCEEEDTILLPELGALLIISTPNGMDTQTCPFNVVLNEDVVYWDAMDDYHWKVQIADNTRPPGIPKDVKVEISGPPPAP
jgi:hypothetical protein